MICLQDKGDHHVTRSSGIVTKIPTNSTLSYQEAVQSILFFEQNFQGYTPRTEVNEDSRVRYIVKQPYIEGKPLGQVLREGNLPDSLKKNIRYFSLLCARVLDKTGIFFDLIGSPYGLRGPLNECSNIIVINQSDILLVDNLLSYGMLRQSVYMRKLSNYLLTRRRRRKAMFIQHLASLQTI